MVDTSSLPLITVLLTLDANGCSKALASRLLASLRFAGGRQNEHNNGSHSGSAAARLSAFGCFDLHQEERHRTRTTSPWRS